MMDRLTRFTTGLMRLLAKEPWSERRIRQRRSGRDRREREAAVSAAPDRREPRGDRRKEERRGRGWLRFWDPQ